MAFENRAHAARLLANDLGSYAGRDPLILAIPRGGLPMGRILADALGGELDVVLVQTMRSPDNREFAIGSIGEGGNVYLGSGAQTFGVSERHLRSEAAGHLESLRRQREFYTPGRKRADPRGREVIVVDDGMISGLTMLAALRAVRARGPRRLIAAVPVAEAATLGKVRQAADEVVCIEVTDRISPLDDFFTEFPPVTDGEALRLLDRETPVCRE